LVNRIGLLAPLRIDSIAIATKATEGREVEM
jgi:hypothetical protein